ncbi:helix-turn-helix domain-containing protein [Paenibacillus sp. CC-CFT747]|nr:helix-turn-helix domain-containing protein [Paenibacillus sp. CC-CFT747]
MTSQDKYTFLVKALLVMVMVSSLPLLLFSSYNINLVITKAMEMVNSKNQNELTRTGVLMNNSLRQVRELANSIMTEKAFASTQTESGKWKALQLLTEKQFANPYIKEVTLYNENQKYMLIPSYGIDRNMRYRPDPEMEAAVSRMSFYEVKTTDTKTDDGHYTVDLIGKLPVVTEDRNSLIIHLDIEKIYYDFLKQLNVDPELYDYYLTNAEGTVLYHPNLALVGQTFSGLEASKPDRKINTYQLDSMNWKLVSEVNSRLLYRDVTVLRGRMVTIAIAASVLLLLLVVMGLRYLYKPFRHIAQRAEENEVKWRKTMLYRLIKDPQPRGADLERFLPAYSSYLLVVVFMIKHGEEAVPDPSSILGMVEDRLAKMFRADFFREEREMISLVQLSDPDINRFLTELMLELDGDLLEQLMICVGGVHSLPDIHNSYTEAMYACNIGRIYSNTDVYCFSKLPMDYETRNLAIPAVEEMELAIRQHNEKAYSEALDVLFSDKLTVVDYNYNFYLTVSLLLRLYGQESLSFLQELNRLITERGIMNITGVKQFFLSKFQTFQKEYDGDTKNYFHKIEAFIASKYRVNFSLDELAEAAGVTKQHLIALFKQFYNRTPVEYINEYRIEKAKQHLADSAARISDVGILAGFNSNSYFAKVFKQYTGITPSEYRQLIHNRQP